MIRIFFSPCFDSTCNDNEHLRRLRMCLLPHRRPLNTTTIQASARANLLFTYSSLNPSCKLNNSFHFFGFSLTWFRLVFSLHALSAINNVYDRLSLIKGKCCLTESYDIERKASRSKTPLLVTRSVRLRFFFGLRERIYSTEPRSLNLYFRTIQWKPLDYN